MSRPWGSVDGVPVFIVDLDDGEWTGVLGVEYFVEEMGGWVGVEQVDPAVFVVPEHSWCRRATQATARTLIGPDAHLQAPFPALGIAAHRITGRD